MNASNTEDLLFREILTSLLRRLVQLVGAAAAVNIARGVPGLMVDPEGNLLDYDRSDPLRAITGLVSQYSRIFGDGTVDLTQHAARALGSGLAESVLQEAGILPSSTATTMRVVLVDDHVLVREGLASLIEPEPDLQVVGQASSMKQAIALARSLHPDLILMDFELPDGTGEEATRLILAEQSSIKIVFLTVHEDDYRMFRAVAAGATGYLFKRISATELLARLRSVARGEIAMSSATAHRILQEFSHLPSARTSRPPAETQLTEREIEIVRQLASGASNREISKRLVISESTVKNHVHNVLFKLHLRSREDAADYARSRGLISPLASEPSGA